MNEHSQDSKVTLKEVPSVKEAGKVEKAESTEQLQAENVDASASSDESKTNQQDDTVDSKSDSSKKENDSSVIDPLSLIDEHEEEISVDGETVRMRGIYLLPNLFTAAALFFGFYAIVTSINGNFETAAVAILAAMIFDGLDGRVARITHTQSKFGAEFDSLADMVSFGVAPAMVMFNWGLSTLSTFGFFCAFIYVACAALRLARFNTQIDTADKNVFSGLASPSAACLLACVIWACVDVGWVGEELPTQLGVLAGCLTAVVGFLMILNVPYNSFKGLDLRGRVPFVVMIFIVFILGLIMLDPARILLSGFLLYALSGPVMAIYKKLSE